MPSYACLLARRPSPLEPFDTYASPRPSVFEALCAYRRPRCVPAFHGSPLASLSAATNKPAMYMNDVPVPDQAARPLLHTRHAPQPPPAVSAKPRTSRTGHLTCNDPARDAPTCPGRRRPLGLGRTVCGCARGPAGLASRAPGGRARHARATAAQGGYLPRGPARPEEEGLVSSSSFSVERPSGCIVSTLATEARDAGIVAVARSRAVVAPQTSSRRRRQQRGALTLGGVYGCGCLTDRSM